MDARYFGYRRENFCRCLCHGLCQASLLAYLKFEYEARMAFTESSRGILVFHAFVKKTQQTPPLEIETARKRLKELFDEQD